MENASKAILIAGSVLLVMAVIGIGMVIYSQTSGTIDNMGTEIDSFAVSAHNNKFTNYVGNVTGTQVLECIQKALTTNSNADLDAKFKPVVVKLSGSEVVNASTTSYKAPSTFKTSKKYTGSVTYDVNGVIKTIEFN